MMGGRLWVESSLGQGSTFHFTAHLGIGSGAAVEVPADPAILLDLPVLVVDDNPTNRQILDEVLNRWHMRPVAAPGGREALEALHSRAPTPEAFRLVLLDAQMPEMDGFTLARLIKEDPSLQGATIMMLSSTDLHSDAARCRELGIDFYLTKPISQADLWNAVLQVLGKSNRLEKHAASQQVQAPSGGTRQLRILLAEDNPVNQKLVVRLLEKRGHSLMVASTGKEALAAFEKHSFDLVLMDIQMPEMGGFETTAVIRENEKKSAQHVPIIALTAHAMKGDRERCLEAGIDDYVTKPIQVKELFEKIDRLSAPRGNLLQ
jgi:CheY-like chemotaxis protein